MRLRPPGDSIQGQADQAGRAGPAVSLTTARDADGLCLTCREPEGVEHNSGLHACAASARPLPVEEEQDED